MPDAHSRSGARLTTGKWRSHASIVCQLGTPSVTDLTRSPLELLHFRRPHGIAHLLGTSGQAASGADWLQVWQLCGWRLRWPRRAAGCSVSTMYAHTCCALTQWLARRHSSPPSPHRLNPAPLQPSADCGRSLGNNWQQQRQPMVRAALRWQWRRQRRQGGGSSLPPACAAFFGSCCDAHCLSIYPFARRRGAALAAWAHNGVAGGGGSGDDAVARWCVPAGSSGARVAGRLGTHLLS